MNINQLSFVPSNQVTKSKHTIEKLTNQSFAEQLQSLQTFEAPKAKVVEGNELNVYEEMIQLLTNGFVEFEIEDVIIDREINPELAMIFDTIKEYFLKQDDMKLTDIDEITDQIIAFFYQLSTVSAEQMNQLDIKNVTKMIQIAQQLPSMVNIQMDDTLSGQMRQLQTIVEDTLSYLEQLAKNEQTNKGWNQSKATIQPVVSQFIKVIKQVNENQVRPTQNNKESVNAVVNQSTPIATFETQSSLSKLEQFTLYFNESKGEATSTNLQQQFEKILARAQFSDAFGVSKLSLKLTPEHLGTLKIELIQRDGMLIANLLATSSKAKQLIESQLHLLRQSFINQNVNVERVEINFTQSDAEETYTRNEQQTSNGQTNDDSSQSKQQDNDSNNHFIDELNELLFETEA